MVAQGARGGGLVVIGSVAKALIQIASVTILSRVLIPDDFGVVAMVAAFVALGSMVRDFGLPTAALQAKELSRQQASNLFWVNVVLATLIGTLLALSSPLLVAAFDEPRLANVVPSMGVVVALGGVTAQLQVQLARDMRYRALVYGDVLSMLTGLAVAISLGVIGAGYMALVAQYVVSGLVLLTARWAATRWRPYRYRRGHGTRSMLRVGAEYGSAQFLTFVQSNVDSVIIGWRLGATSLGYYNRGFQLLSMTSLVLDPLMQVVVPTLNRSREQGRDYEPLLLRIQFIVAMTVAWVLAIAAGTADALVPFVLGSGWDATIPVFQMLSIGGAISALSTVSFWAFMLNEQSRQLLKYNLVSKPLVILCMLFGSSFGIVGVATGYAIGLGISWPINLVWLSRTTNMHGLTFLQNGLMILSSGFAGAVVGGVATSRAMSQLSPLLSVIAGGVAASCTIALVLVVFPSARSQIRGAVHLLKVLIARRPL